MTLSPPEKLRIVVLGYLIRGPLGGLAWHYLQYVLGLARLGHEVFYFEDSDDYPSCYDPERNVTDADPSFGLSFASRAFERIGLPTCWAYHDAHRQQWLGPRASHAEAICRDADLLLNISGVNPFRDWFLNVPCRVLVDTDPVFTQVRNVTDPGARATAEAHTAFFSFGENLESGRSTVPRDGLPWRATRQPVVLDAWPVVPAPPEGLFTTVMQWDSYPAREYGGRHFGMKSRSFQAYLDLPQRTAAGFELACGSPTAPRDLLRASGWRVRDPLEPTRDPWVYQRYLQASRAEFSVAKHGYVVTRSGWFSERSAVYLASGRPVVTQETGFSDRIPTGLGVLSFSTPDEALEAVEDVIGRYECHRRAARGIAEAYFDARKVLPSLLERSFAAQRPGPTEQGREERTAAGAAIGG